MLFTPVKKTDMQATCSDKNGTLFKAPVSDNQASFGRSTLASAGEVAEECVLGDISSVSKVGQEEGKQTLANPSSWEY
jgi:hypothetical protein